VDEARWVEAQQRDLLPVQYFHLVFTVPTELHALFLTAPSVAYKLLFTAAAKTLEAVARRRLRAKIGFTAVLHTWTQLLLFHPHIHCIVPGGGLDAEDTRWLPARRDFFLPVRVLSRVFRGKLLSLLEKALDKKLIREAPDGDAHRRLKQAARKPWVVYSKPPFAGAEQVLAYLGRYAYRIALSNDRLVTLDNGQVTFRWKDRAHGNAPRLATLDAPTFLRRFLLHVLPRRFVRIRHYGFLANAVRPHQLPRVRQLLVPAAVTIASHAPREPEQWEALLLRLTGKDVTGCPRCGVGPMRVIEELPAWPDEAPRFLAPSQEPMNPDASRSALSASAQTRHARANSNSRLAVPSQFIVARLGPRPPDAANFPAHALAPDRCAPPLTCSINPRPGPPSAGGFVQCDFFAHRGSACRPASRPEARRAKKPSSLRYVRAVVGIKARELGVGAIILPPRT
jgi:hypothetical protein